MIERVLIPRLSSSVHGLVGEPPLKMLRYQQQFTFFDVAKINRSVRFVNLAREAMAGGPEEVLKRIVQEVEATSAGVVAVDRSDPPCEPRRW